MILTDVKTIIGNRFSGNIVFKFSSIGELSIDVDKFILVDFCKFLRDSPDLKLSALVDLSGVDYLDYGKTYWRTTESTVEGFSRGHKSDLLYSLYMKNRFCVSYHLLSYNFNFRVRLRVFVSLDDMSVPSVVGIWPTANWHEREVYDLFGVVFENHPNLKRILTDYGFEGYPLRKDFPLTGEYEIRYDENKEKIVREASSIKRVINTPKVVRNDFRYR